MADERRSPSWKSTDWRGGAGAGPASAKKTGGSLRYLLLAAVLAILGVVAGLIMFLRPPKEPIFLSIAVTEHVNRSLPPNPWARQDGEALRIAFGKNSVQAFQSQERDLILRELAQLADRTAMSADRTRPVIVHLCAYAVVRNNAIYLLAGFSQPDAPGSWLPLAEVFDVLRRCQGACLVLLDVARPIADARLGILSDDAGTAIHAELKRLEGAGQLPFLVLTSSGEREVGHPSLVLRRSVFGYFVEQGLSGHADGWEAGKSKDGQVSARELAGYVRTQVVEWAAQLRLPAQQPAVYGTGKDFVLITPQSKPAPPALPDPAEAYPDWLIKAWQARDQWLQDQSWRRVPRALRQLETALLRAEQRWLAGDETQSIQNELKATASEMEQHRRQFTPANYAPHSLALAQRHSIKHDPALSARLQAVTDRLQSKTPFMAGELDMLWQKAFEKPPEPAQVDFIATTVFRTLVEIPDPTREQLKAGLDALSKLQPKPRHLEVQLLQLVVDLEAAQWQRWQELAGAAHVVLQAGHLAEQLAASDPRCLPWLQDELAAADTRRRDGLLQLTIGEAAERRQGKVKLDDAVKRYQTLAAAAKALEQGWQRQEEAYRILPAMAPELGRRTPDPADMQFWSATIQNAEKLAMLLTPPATPELPAVKEIEALAQDLGVQLNYAQARYQADSLDRQLRRLNTPNAPAAAELFGQLRSPVWNAVQRGRLYDAASKLERETAEAAIARAAQLSPAAPLAVNSETVRDAPAWRARLAIDLLKLDGLSESQSLQAELAKAAGAPSSEVWQDLGAKVRAASAGTLLKRFKESKFPLLQERAGWFLSTDELAATSVAGNEPFPREPAALARRKQQTDFWRWLGEERYIKDANAFLKIATRPELAAYGRALNEIGRELASRSP